MGTTSLVSFRSPRMTLISAISLKPNIVFYLLSWLEPLGFLHYDSCYLTGQPTKFGNGVRKLSIMSNQLHVTGEMTHDRSVR